MPNSATIKTLLQGSAMLCITFNEVAFTYPVTAVLLGDFLPEDLNFCSMVLNLFQSSITSPVIGGF
jgi:hypothetical protein